MKYKVGDRVKMKESDRDGWKYSGSIMTIYWIEGWGTVYKMEEDKRYYEWSDEMIEWLAEEEEWKPKEGDVVLVRDKGTKWKERNFIMQSRSWKYLCWFWLNDDGSVFPCPLTYWEEIKKPEDKKRERKIMMTDSEWDKFQKDHNF